MHIDSSFVKVNAWTQRSCWGWWLVLLYALGFISAGSPVAASGLRQVRFLYDADGHATARVTVELDPRTGERKTNTVRWLIDAMHPSGQPVRILELDESHRRRLHIQGVHPIATGESGSDGAVATPTFFAEDGRGGSLPISPDRLEIFGQDRKDAFGHALSSSDELVSVGKEAEWGGSVQDPTTGAYYLRSRWYDPGRGQFHTADTFAGRPYEPATRHRYLYCRDDPVNRLDPDGHDSLVSVSGAGALMTQFAGHELRGAGAVLGGVRELFGADDPLNSLINAIEIATIVDEKVGQLALGVTAVVGGVRLVGLTGEYLASQGPLRFSQATASVAYGDGSLFAGKTIGQVSELLRKGVLKPEDVPVKYITRTANGQKIRLIVNTRSSLALKRALVPENRWRLIDETADTQLQGKITERLENNGLTNEGTDVLRIGKRSGPKEYSILD